MAVRQTLDFSETRLSSMDVLMNYPDLREVILSHNSISSITHLDFAPKLLEINLDHNSISRIENLNSCKGLVTLNLSYNAIYRIEGLETLVYLEHLDLSHNNIAVISNLWRLINLKSLNLAHNKIKAFGDLLANTNLNTLDLSYNAILVLETNSELLPLSVKHMNLRGNNIQNILEVRVLEELEGLIEVDLDENPMIQIIENKGINAKMFLLYLLRNLKLIELNRETINIQEKATVNQLSDSINPEIFKYPNELPLLFKMLAERIPALPNRQKLVSRKTDRVTYKINENRIEKLQGPSRSPSNTIPQNSVPSTPAVTPKPPIQLSKPQEPDKLDFISQQLLELSQIVKDLVIRPSLSQSQTSVQLPLPNSASSFTIQPHPISSSSSTIQPESSLALDLPSKSFSLPKSITDIHQLSLKPLSIKSLKNYDRSTPPNFPLKKVVKIQAAIRRFLTRCRFLSYLKSVFSALKIQSYWRGYLVRRKLNPISAYNTKCPDCLRLMEYILPEIKSLKQEMRLFIEEQRSLFSTSIKHEKALRYLFDQVAGLQKVVRTS